jgi:Bacterial conjugation TrbI-like protein
MQHPNPVPGHEDQAPVLGSQERIEQVADTQFSDSERRPFVVAKRAGGGGNKGDNTTRMLIAFGVAVVLLIAFLGFISTKGGEKKKTAAQSGKPNLGRVIAPGSPGEVIPADKMAATPSEQSRGIGAEDIEKTRTPKFGSPNDGGESAAAGASKASLGQIPKFEKPDTDHQQDWSPEPYGSRKASNSASQSQLTKAEEEYGKSSLVFVAHGTATSTDASARLLPAIDNFGLGSGYHVAARLESMASTALQAPVTAVIEYNYARDGHVLIPAGARAVGKVSQADASGIMNITFDSIEMPTGESVPISAIGATTSLEAIKGQVTGKHLGRSIAVRSLAGLGEAGAMLVGQGNVNSAYSESDMIRERAAENIGNAGDAQVMGLMTTQHIVVSVPAGTEIYLVFTRPKKISPTSAQGITMPPAEQ